MNRVDIRFELFRRYKGEFINGLGNWGGELWTMSVGRGTMGILS